MDECPVGDRGRAGRGTSGVGTTSGGRAGTDTREIHGDSSRGLHRRTSFPVVEVQSSRRPSVRRNWVSRPVFARIVDVVDLTPEMCVGGRELTEPKLSPDGAVVAFVARWEGSSAIVLVPSIGNVERLLATPVEPAAGRGLGGGCFDWLPDGSGLAYVAVDGDVWLQQVPGGHGRRLTTHGPERRAEAPVVAPDAASVVYVVDQAEVWRVELHGGAPQRIDDGAADFCFDPHVAPDGVTVSWQAWNVPDMPWDGARTEWFRLDTEERRRLEGAGTIQQPRSAPDGTPMSVRDDTGWLNVWLGDGPVVDEPFEHAGPTWGQGQRSYAVSPDGGRLALARNEGGFGRLCVVSRSTGTVDAVARGVHGQLTWRGASLVALRSGARTPTEVVCYDTTTWNRETLAVGPAAGWDDVDLPEPESVEVAGEGVLLHARRYTAGRGRAICWVHGGPTDQWRVEFMPRVAYWWSRGWDVLVPDPRGTTGHGRAYQQALHGGWGVVDVDDTAAILRHSHDRGWSETSRTVVMGGSSGGLTALGVLGRHDGLAAAGVVLYPVTDLVELAARSHRFEAHSTISLVGPLDDVQRYRERSPLAYADRIHVPLLVMHGDRDDVVPVEQSVMMAERVRAAGGDVELHVFEGEGHGFRRREHKLREFELIARFLTRIG